MTGLPDGVGFKKPNAYGTNTIQVIMKNSENIKFSTVQRQIGDCEATVTARYFQAGEIIDSDKQISIKEENLEVANLDLSASDF